MKLDHIAIWTNNLERMKQFYLTYFDCRVSERYDNIAKEFSSYFISFGSEARIEIMKQPDKTGKPSSNSIGPAHFAIGLDSREQVDLLTDILEKAGIAVDRYPRITGDGYYESVILDPDGNKIELTTPVDKR